MPWPGGRRVAIVTGGSRGLGLALAQALAEQGIAPILLARGEEELKRAARSIATAERVEALIHPVDVTDEAALQSLADNLQAQGIKVDFLFNNAGVGALGTLAKIPLAQVRRDVEVTLLGSILVTRIFLPLIPRGGRIVFVSSTLGLMGAAGY